MQLIEDLGTRLLNNVWIRFGIFLCPFCLQRVEKIFFNGIKAKSCGCYIWNKGKVGVYSEEILDKMGKAKRGKYAGKNNPNYGNGDKIRGTNNPMYGKKHTKETRQKIKDNHADQRGENNPNWQNGISFEPYSPEFNKEKKQQILERDNNQCQFPNCTEIHDRLHVHHIDYNKKNNSSENLIILGTSCHMKTNYNRQYWIEFYQNIMINRIVECLL